MLETKICKECGKEFETKIGNQKFCSLECRNRKHDEIVKLKKEFGISHVSKLEVEKIKEKEKQAKLTILD